MSYIVGIDVGGSTTKIVAFDHEKKIVAPMFVKAEDQMTSIYGAFGKFTNENSLNLDDIEKVMVTGVGSAYIDKPIYNLECVHIPEFKCIGRGGLYLTGLEKAIVISMGTGTAITYAENGTLTYLGGTGVGGGTLMGLAKKLLDMEDIENIVNLAKDGDLDRVDLQIKDITRKDSNLGLPSQMTASNFGKVSDLTTKGDVALGIINMVFETVAMMGVFSARNYGVSDVILTGNLTSIPQANAIFSPLNSMFNVNFIIPENSQYATVIGAALSSRK